MTYICPDEPSKHLKGRLGPNVFWIKGGHLDPPVRDVTFFGPKMKNAVTEINQ